MPYSSVVDGPIYFKYAIFYCLTKFFIIIIIIIIIQITESVTETAIPVTA